MEINGISKSEEYYSFVESKINLELTLQRSYHYGRQFPIGKYFADFYFPENKLVLEIDGKEFHSDSEAVEHDRARNEYMNKQGYSVVRVTGSIAHANPSGVINAIRGVRDGKTHFVDSEADLKNLLIFSSSPQKEKEKMIKKGINYSEFKNTGELPKCMGCGKERKTKRIIFQHCGDCLLKHEMLLKKHIQDPETKRKIIIEQQKINRSL